MVRAPRLRRPSVVVEKFLVSQILRTFIEYFNKYFTGILFCLYQLLVSVFDNKS